MYTTLRFVAANMWFKQIRLLKRIRSQIVVSSLDLKPATFWTCSLLASPSFGTDIVRVKCTLVQARPEGKKELSRCVCIDSSQVIITVVFHLGFLSSLQPSIIVLNTGAPQGCVLSPLLYSLFTNGCVSNQASVQLIKFLSPAPPPGHQMPGIACRTP